MALRVRSMLLLLAILAVFLGVWQIAATPSAASGPALDPEYAKLLGVSAQQGQQTPMPRPSDIAERAWHHLRDPFYIRGANDQGLGIQLGWSLLRGVVLFLVFGLVSRWWLASMAKMWLESRLEALQAKVKTPEPAPTRAGR